MLNVSYTHYNRDTHPIFVSDTFKKGKNILQLAMPAFYLCVLRTPSLFPTATPWPLFRLGIMPHVPAMLSQESPIQSAMLGLKAAFFRSLKNLRCLKSNSR